MDTRFSSLQQLLRVMAWIRRWCTSSSNSGNNSRELEITTEELSTAHDRWVRVIQRTTFQELDAISKEGIVSDRSSLRRLSPFMDDHGILRVGGRIKNAILSHDQRHPIILPNTSHFTYLVVEAHHRRTLHGGAQLTLMSIRQRYWIPGGRQRVRRHIHRCVSCARWRTASPQPLMGGLLRGRVTPG